jgi:Flp pilus assembly CpaE family ATPase
MPSSIFASVRSSGPDFGSLFKRGHKGLPSDLSKSQDQVNRPNQSTATTSDATPVSLAAPIVAVLGAKGGVGASTIAVNLAAAAAASGLTTTLVDANFQMPDVANLVGHEASHSLLELTSRGKSIDQLIFQACRQEVLADSRSLGVLLPPSDGEAAIKSNLTQLADCLDQVKHFNDLFVVDVPGHLDRHLVTLLDRCAQIVLVFEATISGVAACHRWLQIFTELGYERDRVILVCNRSGSKYKGVEQQLGTCFAGMNIRKIPNASSLTRGSSNNGIPAVSSHSGSRYARAINKLSVELQQILIKR